MRSWPSDHGGQEAPQAPSSYKLLAQDPLSSSCSKSFPSTGSHVNPSTPICDQPLPFTHWFPLRIWRLVSPFVDCRPATVSPGASLPLALIPSMQCLLFMPHLIVCVTLFSYLLGSVLWGALLSLFSQSWVCVGGWLRAGLIPCI